VKWLGACTAKRVPAQPLVVVRIISCRHRHCPARSVSWHQWRPLGRLGIGRQHQPAQNPIGAQRYLTNSRCLSRRHSAWRLRQHAWWKKWQRKSGSERSSRLDVRCTDHRPLSQLAHDRLCPLVMAKPLSQLPHLAGAKQVTKLPLHARLHTGQAGFLD